MQRDVIMFNMVKTPIVNVFSVSIVIRIEKAFKCFVPTNTVVIAASLWQYSCWGSNLHTSCLYPPTTLPPRLVTVACLQRNSLVKVSHCLFQSGVKLRNWTHSAKIDWGLALNKSGCNQTIRLLVEMIVVFSGWHTCSCCKALLHTVRIFMGIVVL